jgi:hypothetical protein
MTANGWGDAKNKAKMSVLHLTKIKQKEPEISIRVQSTRPSASVARRDFFKVKKVIKK